MYEQQKGHYYPQTQVIGNINRNNRYNNNNQSEHHSHRNQNDVRIIHLNSNRYQDHPNIQNDAILFQKSKKSSNLRRLRVLCGIFLGIIMIISGIIALASNPQDQDDKDAGIALLIVGSSLCCFCMCPNQKSQVRIGRIRWNLD